MAYVLRRIRWLKVYEPSCFWKIRANCSTYGVFPMQTVLITLPLAKHKMLIVLHLSTDYSVDKLLEFYQLKG